MPSTSGSKDAAAVAAFRAGRLCQSSSAGACCTPSLQSEVPLCRASAQRSLGGAEPSQGDLGASCTILPSAELSCSPCTHRAAGCCAWVWPMAEHHSTHRGGNRKQSSHKKHPVNKPTSSWSQASAAPEPARNQANCPSAGKTEMHTRFSTDASPLSPESISVLVPRHQWCQPLPGIFFSKAYEWILYVFLLHQVSHDQVMCVFLKCHLSAPVQCSNTTSVKHIFCSTLIGQGGLGHSAILIWFCFYILLLLSTQRSDFLHNHFPTPMSTKIDKGHAKSTSVYENTWRTEVQKGTIVPKHPHNRPVKGTVCRELWNQRGNTGWPGLIPMTRTPWHFWQLDTKVNTNTPTGPVTPTGHTGTAREALAKEFSLHGVLCWAERRCCEQLAVLHTAHLQGTWGTWRGP